MALPPPPGIAPEAAKDYLRDLASRLEFRSAAEPSEKDVAEGKRLAEELALLDEDGAPPRPSGLQLHALQAFVVALLDPRNPTKRFLLSWDTGTGKTIPAIRIAQNYVQSFRELKHLEPGDRPTVFVVGFTRAVIQAEMLRDPSHGFITFSELQELRRLRQRARNAPAGSPEIRQYNGYLGTMKRLLTDRGRGGYYRFFGYKEFATQLIVVTPLGEKAGVKVLDLFLREGRGEEHPEGTSQMEVFVRRIALAEKKGHVRVNAELLASLRRGLIVADEIHNVYNVNDPNMYGVAIQYALDVYSLSGRADESPRAIFMSATPMSGSPAEIVDLLNLLVPREELPDGRPLKRKDFFGLDRRGRLEYLPGAVDKIAALASGRVSFLTVEMENKNFEDPLFPVREFVGDTASGPAGEAIPYLRFVKYPLAPAHAAALAHWAAKESRPVERGLLPSPGEYALYDMVFPNPEGETPLYESPSAQTLYSVLLKADPAWRARHGVQIIPGNTASGRNNPVVSGDILRLENLRKYSGKYARFVEDLHSILREGPGKVLVYHDRIQLTGVALLSEILRMNGFVEVGDPTTPATLCSICGKRHRSQKEKGSHKFVPARFTVVTGSMEAGAKEKALSRFNLFSNLEGHDVRVLLGSQVIIEGLNFQAVRHQCVLSVPRNISSLVQILGRAVRRGAHRDLPPEERRVRVRLYVCEEAAPGGARAPDLVKAARKMSDYTLIQRALAALRRGAVNSFLPQSRPAATAEASLEGVPFAPEVTSAEAEGLPVVTSTYFAHDLTVQNLRRLTAAIRALFTRRPVWKREELEKALRRPGLVEGQALNPAFYREGLVSLAVDLLLREEVPARGAGGGRLVAAHVQDARGEYRRVVAAGEFLVAAPVGSRGVPETDVESWARVESTSACRPLRVSLRKHVDLHLRKSNFNRRLEQFREAYSGAKGAEARRFLVDYDEDFHYQLLELLVQKGAGADPALQLAEKVYRKFRVLFSASDLEGAEGYSTLAARAAGPGKASGYLSRRSARVWAKGRGGPGWEEVPLAALGAGGVRPENSTVVGYTEVRRARLTFKIRRPVQELLTARKEQKDIRSVPRGAVCVTRPNSDLVKLAKQLTGLPEKEVRGRSNPRLCRLILDRLLREEEAARAPAAGLKKGVRWFYLFNETPPAVGPA